mgnify:CR=1 FL=1
MYKKTFDNRKNKKIQQQPKKLEQKQEASKFSLPDPCLNQIEIDKQRLVGSNVILKYFGKQNGNGSQTEQLEAEKKARLEKQKVFFFLKCVG